MANNQIRYVVSYGNLRSDHWYKIPLLQELHATVKRLNLWKAIQNDEYVY